VASSSATRTCCSSARPASAKSNRRKTRLVDEACSSEVTVTDPTHPLHGRTLRLVGTASPPRMGRCCMVEVFDDVCAHVPIACTNLAPRIQRVPTVLRVDAIRELVKVYEQAAAEVATNADLQRVAVGSPHRRRARPGRRSRRADPRGGTR
jgi:hypothetical protein